MSTPISTSMSTANPTERTAPTGQQERPEARAARLRLRRRLVVWSLPVVVVLALVALKLGSLVALGDRAREAYAAGNVSGVESAARSLGFLNVLEPHKAPFAAGDAKVLAQDYDGARASFEEALALAPADSVENCQVRVNLVLSLEKLGAAATEAGQAAASATYNDRILAVTEQAPQGCFEGDAKDDEGQQLKDAQQRAEQQQSQQGQDQSQTPSQDQGQQPSQDKQQQLDDKTKDNLQQRGQSDQPPGSSSRPPVDKPW